VAAERMLSKMEKSVNKGAKTQALATSAIEKLIRQIDDLYRSQHYDQVIAKADHLLQIDPDSLKAYFFRGSSFMKMKRYPEAISDFSFIIQRDPDHVAKAGRSICYGKLNKMDRKLAENIIDEAIKKYPEDSDLLNCRAIMNYHNGELLEALEDYSSAIKRFSEPLEHYYLYRGELYLELKDYDKAIDDFNEALKSKPNEFNHPYLFFNRAKAYFEKGEPEKAELDIRRAISLNPDEEDFHKLAAKIIPRSSQISE